MTATGDDRRTVVFFVSGHGFGHASREVAIMNALGDRMGARLRLIVRSAVSPTLLARTLRVPYELRAGACDTGVIQSNSVTHDDVATVDAARAFYATFDARVDAEAAALANDRVAAVVADIAPLGLAVGARLGVPALFIGNFTWDWIYDAYRELRSGLNNNIVSVIRRAQAQATLAFRLPLSPSFAGTGLDPVIDVPLVARQASQSREDTRRALGLPLARRLVLLSFGGYGLNELDVAAADCMADWDVVSTDRSVSPERAGGAAHVHWISERALADTRYENLVAAVDAVITKPGYGIISECATAGTPMLYTSRGAFREYDVLVEDMPKYLRCAFLPQADLFAGRWRDGLTALMAQPAPPERLPATGAAVLAERIVAAVLGPSRP